MSAGWFVWKQGGGDLESVKIGGMMGMWVMQLYWQGCFKDSSGGEEKNAGRQEVRTERVTVSVMLFVCTGVWGWMRGCFITDHPWLWGWACAAKQTPFSDLNPAGPHLGHNAAAAEQQGLVDTSLMLSPRALTAPAWHADNKSHQSQLSFLLARATDPHTGPTQSNPGVLWDGSRF